MDYDKKIKELREQINQLSDEKNLEIALTTAKKYGINIGDIVEVEYTEEDDYIYHNTEWKKGAIQNISKSSVRVYFIDDDNEEWVNVENVKLFDENDYTLRHKLWNRLLEPGDKIKIIVEVENLILGEIYEVNSIFRNKNTSHCFVLNEQGNEINVSANKYHITHEKKWKPI